MSLTFLKVIPMMRKEQKAKPSERGINKKQIHKLLDKASQPIKKSEKGKP